MSETSENTIFVWFCLALLSIDNPIENLAPILSVLSYVGLLGVRLSDPSKKRRSEGHGLDELVFFPDSPRVTIGK